MLVASCRPYDPGNLTQAPSLDVGGEGGRRDEVRLGRRRALDVREVLQPRGRGGVDLPGHLLLIELLEYRLEIERRRDGVVDYPPGGPRDEVEVVWEALAHHG